MIELLRSGAAALVLLAPITVATQAAELPDAIAAKGEVIVTQLHAEGAQIYECKADAGGQLTWQFREPVASLFLNGATVGRHYAGPTWESGGSAVVGKAVARSRCRVQGHPVVEAGGIGPAWRWPVEERDHGTAHQHQGWKC
jgi:hypothetical protein